MTSTCRGRLFVRRLPMVDFPSAPTARPAGHGYGMVGVLEMDDAAPWARERSHGLHCLLNGSGASMAFTGSSDAPDHDDVAFAEMDRFLTSMRFPRADEVHEALGRGAGGMVLRDTRGPSSPGTTLATVAIALCLPDDDLPDTHMASIEISGGERPACATIRIDGPCPLATNGMSLSQVHRLPLWGWEDEPFSLQSTMSLAAIDVCTRAQQRMIADDVTPDEERRLRIETRHAVQDNSDPVFAAFRRRSAAEGLLLPWDAAPKASEILSRQNAVKILVAELLEMREQGAFA